MQLTIIIPAINEADELAELLPRLRKYTQGRTAEIYVADGGSTDNSAEVCARNQVHFVACPRPGRSLQMNYVAAEHPADVYYFLHADTRPPASFYEDIRKAVQTGHDLGCYRFRFDMLHPLLAINAYCTRLPYLPCRGGDQSLFVTHDAFTRLNGYREDYIIMEDYDIIERAEELAMSFRILPKNILVSARKYRANGYFKVQLANLKVFRMYRRGEDQRAMLDLYKARLNPW
ncbi:MAG: TIGR04283 family arsenosugar biosynthesis glycosyltransferase [Saprospiraceae bacterium]